MREYGLEEGEYARILAAQDGRCALCGKRPGRVRLAVDHDHITKRVRGLIHSRCNRGLAPFESNIQALTNLIGYAAAIIQDRIQWASRT